MKNKFRVLLVYPNIPGMLVLSVGIGLFTSILKKHGFDVELFDATLFKGGSVSPEKRTEYLQTRDFSYDKDLGINFEDNVIDAFVKKVDEFKPDLLVVSVVEDAFGQAMDMLEAVEDRNIPHIVGGVFVTACPEFVIRQKQVSMICVGEGEQAVLEIAQKIRDGVRIEGTDNIWVKMFDGKVIKGETGELVDINKEMADYSLFDKVRFYRPMGGKVLKTVPLEMFRGCPYGCTYCNSPMWKTKFGNKFLRRKSLGVVMKEVVDIVDKYEPELLYIIDDTFLARPDSEIREFVERYKEYAVPFWFNTRPETITKERLELMKEAGCYRISVGLECGNDDYRKKRLKRNITNEELVKRMNVLRDSGIPFSINNIIGFPDETRRMILDTIKLDRILSGYDSLTVSIFTPYHGTVLREEAVRAGYLKEESVTKHTTSSSQLCMPQISSKELDGLMRTFVLYVKFPEKWWGYVEKAETDDVMFGKLSDIYKRFLISNNQFVVTEKVDWNELEKMI